MQLTFDISSGCKKAYNNISISRLNQVVFIGENFDELVVYTGMVCAGTPKDSADIKVNKNSFCVELSFFVAESDVDIISDVKFECVLSDFAKELEPIKKALGPHCSKPSTGDSLNDAYNSIYNEDMVDNENHKEFFIIRSPGLALPNTQTIAYIQNITDFEDGSNKYQIIPNRTLPKNINLLTWVRTTIRLSKGIKDFSYKLQKEGNIDVLHFTSYYVLPQNHNADSPNLICKYIGEDEKEGLSKNPLQPCKVDHSAYFSEWRKKKIAHKTYYRLLLPDTGKNISSFEYFVISFDFISQNLRGLGDLVKGVLITLYFSFGMNASRFYEIPGLFAFGTSFSPEIIWTTVGVLFLLGLFISPIDVSGMAYEKGRKKGKPVKKKKFRAIIYIMFLVWCAFVYVSSTIGLNYESWPTPILYAIQAFPIASILTLIAHYITSQTYYDFSFITYVKSRLRNL